MKRPIVLSVFHYLGMILLFASTMRLPYFGRDSCFYALVSAGGVFLVGSDFLWFYLVKRKK